MSVALELASETYNETVLARLSLHFGGSTDLHLFEQIFLWHFKEPINRQRPIVEEAAEVFEAYQRKDTLPGFFRILYTVLEARQEITEADCAPYARADSPKFWRYVFHEHFGEEPVDDPGEVKKDLERERKRAVDGNTDKRWDELFLEGIPMYRKLQTASL